MLATIQAPWIYQRLICEREIVNANEMVIGVLFVRTAVFVLMKFNMDT